MLFRAALASATPASGQMELKGKKKTLAWKIHQDSASRQSLGGTTNIHLANERPKSRCILGIRFLVARRLLGSLVSILLGGSLDLFHDSLTLLLFFLCASLILLVLLATTLVLRINVFGNFGGKFFGVSGNNLLGSAQYRRNFYG